MLKYQNNLNYIGSIETALCSRVFGGSIFNPIRAAQGGIGGSVEIQMGAKAAPKKIEKGNMIR